MNKAFIYLIYFYFYTLFQLKEIIIYLYISILIFGFFFTIRIRSYLPTFGFRIRTDLKCKNIFFYDTDTRGKKSRKKNSVSVSTFTIWTSLSIKNDSSILSILRVECYCRFYSYLRTFHFKIFNNL